MDLIGCLRPHTEPLYCRLTWLHKDLYSVGKSTGLPFFLFFQTSTCHTITMSSGEYVVLVTRYMRMCCI
jgi:hypothetical protein